MMRKPKPSSKDCCLLVLVVVFGAPACGELIADPSIVYSDPFRVKEVIHVYVGENITMHCTKSSSFSGSVMFYIGDDTVPGEYVIVVNNTCAHLHRPALDEDSFSLNIQCRDDDDEIDSTTVYVDYPPRIPVNLTRFEWFNKDMLIFAWDLGVPTYKALDGQNPNIPQIIVTAEYRYNDSLNWTACTTGSCRDCYTSCREKGGEIGRGGVSLRVNVTNNVRNDSTTAIFNVADIINHVKPKPPENLHVEALNSTCVNLTWEADRTYFKAEVKICRLPCSIRRDNQSVQVPESSDGRYKHVTCGLHPAYHYSFEIRLKPKEAGYLSEPTDIALEMPEDVPASCPRVLKSGYHRRSTGEVIVYFQPVPEDHQNGKIVTYTAKFGSYPIDTQNASHGLYFSREVPSDQGLNVTLYANTKKGQSPPSERFYVPPLDEVKSLLDEIQGMDLVVGKNETHAIVTWTPPAVGTTAWDNTLLLYYCYSSTELESICKNDIQYVEVNATEGRYSLQAANNRKFESTARFGLAATTPDDRGSGIVYTKCIYSLMKENGIPDSIKPTATPSIGFIHVQWSSTRCDGKRIIWNYVIKYCSVRSKEDPECISGNKTITVKGDTTQGYRLQDVEEGKMYKITVQANTSSSAELTLQGDPAYAELPVNSRSLKPGEWVGVSIGVLVVVLALGGLVCWTVRRWCREANATFNPKKSPEEMKAMEKTPRLLQITREQNSFPQTPHFVPTIPNGGENELNGSVPVKPPPLPSARPPTQEDRGRLLNDSVTVRTLPTTDDDDTTRKATINGDETTAKTPTDPMCPSPVMSLGLAETPSGIQSSSGKPVEHTAPTFDEGGYVKNNQIAFGSAGEIATRACISKVVNEHPEYVRSTVNHGSSDGIVTQPSMSAPVIWSSSKTESSGTIPVGNDPLVHATTGRKNLDMSGKPESTSSSLHDGYVYKPRLETPPEGFAEEKEDTLAVEQEDQAGDRTTSKHAKTGLLIQRKDLGAKSIVNRRHGTGGCLLERVEEINGGESNQNTHCLSNEFPPQPAGLDFNTAELDIDKRSIKEADHLSVLEERYSERTGVDATNLCKNLPTRCKQNPGYLPNGCPQSSPSAGLLDLSDRSDWQCDDDRGDNSDDGNDGNRSEAERKSDSKRMSSPCFPHTEVDLHFNQMTATYTTDTHVMSPDALIKQNRFQHDAADQMRLPYAPHTQATGPGLGEDADGKSSRRQLMRSDSGYHSLAGRQFSAPTSP